MRAQPWYQDWFRSQHLDPNHVHLSGDQRQQLQQLILQRGGVPQDSFNDMKIDPAGNLNTEHGFASQPTWLKALEIGAPIAGADFLSGGALHAPIQAALMGGGGAAPGASTVAGGTAASGATGGLSMLPNLTGGMSSLVPSIGTSVGLGTGPIAGGSGGIMSKLLGHLPGHAEDYANTGRLLESFGNDEQSNRIAKGNFAQGYDQNMLAAQRDKRLQESDAMNKLAASGYVLGGGSKYASPSIQLGGQSRTLPSSGLGPTQVSDAEKQGASTLQAEMLKRMGPNGSYVPQPLDSYATPGKAERVGQYGSAAVAGVGALKNLFGF